MVDDWPSTTGVAGAASLTGAAADVVMLSDCWVGRWTLLGLAFASGAEADAVCATRSLILPIFLAGRSVEPVSGTTLRVSSCCCDGCSPDLGPSPDPLGVAACSSALSLLWAMTRLALRATLAAWCVRAPAPAVCMDAPGESDRELMGDRDASGADPAATPLRGRFADEGGAESESVKPASSRLLRSPTVPFLPVTLLADVPPPAAAAAALASASPATAATGVAISLITPDGFPSMVSVLPDCASSMLSIAEQLVVMVRGKEAGRRHRRGRPHSLSPTRRHDGLKTAMAIAQEL